MKKTILLLVVLSHLSIVNGQQYYPFPDSGAIWNNAQWEYSFGNTTYSQYGLMGDTLINSIQYHKLYMLNDSSLNLLNATYVGAIREQTKRIFFRYIYCQEEVLLYDFTKQVGDSIHSLFSEHEILSCDSTTPYDGIITDIDSTLIGDSYRKVYHIGPWYPDWIEGIGSLAGLLNPIPPQITGFDTWDLVCYKKDEVELYLNPDFSTCFPLNVGINDNIKKSNSGVRLYPHPVTDISSFDLISDENKFKYLTIYNIFGQTVYHLEISNKNTIQLDRTDFTSGLLLYKIETINGQCITGKIIIE